MEKYESPKFEVEYLEVQDVICTSVTPGGDETPIIPIP